MAAADRITEQNPTQNNAEPLLAVFWYVGEEFIGPTDVIDGETVKAYGAYLQVDVDHFAVWDGYRDKLGLPGDLEYDYFPRGRVMYNTEVHKYTVICDARIRHRKDIMAKLFETYHIPESAIVKQDEHYRSTCGLDRDESFDRHTEELRQELTDQWEGLMASLYDEELFSTEEFKGLFRRTWQYFLDRIRDDTLPRKDIPLIGKLYAFHEYRGGYPENTPHWEFDAASCFVEGLLETLADPDWDYYGRSFRTGHIIVFEDFRYETVKTLSDFEQEFTELSEEYKENVYDGGIE